MNGSGRGGVLCVGEPLISLTPQDDAGLTTTGRLSVSVGGAELNVAVHLARHGIRSRLAGLVGDDPWGQRIRYALRREGVEDEFLVTHPQKPTGVYFKDPQDGLTRVYYYRAGSAGSSLHDVPSEAFSGMSHIHISGVTAALSEGAPEWVDRLIDGAVGRSVSFDVNYRTSLWAATSAATILLHLARKSQIVFVGLDEAAELWGCRNAIEVRDLLPSARELVVKDGSNPATAFTPTDEVVSPAQSIAVRESTGAGDAFAAGYLASRIRGHSTRAALQLGHELAGAVLQSLGDYGSTVHDGAPQGRQPLAGGRTDA